MTASDTTPQREPHAGSVPSEQSTAGQSFRWPLIAVCLLLGHAVLMMVAVAIATADPGATASEAGYAEALDWDRHKEIQRRSDSLGWKATMTPSAVTAIDGGRQVVVELLDSNRQPVDGAAVELDGYQLSQAHRPMKIALDRVSPGVYRGTAPMRRPGAWRLRISAQRGEDRFVESLEVWVAPIDGSAPQLLSGPNPGGPSPTNRGDQ